jgi:hypothetical protein
MATRVGEILRHRLAQYFFNLRRYRKFSPERSSILRVFRSCTGPTYVLLQLAMPFAGRSWYLHRMERKSILHSQAQAPPIRLLKLEPTSDDGMIHCSRHVVPLSEAGRYEAVSYVWGDPALKKDHIICDNRLQNVTPNLYSALFHLRSPDSQRVLWIDQLCIDQDDLKEPAQQVEMMGEIYSKASRVLIWLGRESPETRESFNAIRKLRAFFAEDRTSFFSAFTHERNTFRKPEIVLDKLFKDDRSSAGRWAWKFLSLFSSDFDPVRQDRLREEREIQRLFAKELKGLEEILENPWFVVCG